MLMSIYHITYEKYLSEIIVSTSPHAICIVASVNYTVDFQFAVMMLVSSSTV